MLITTEKIIDFWKIRGVPEWPGWDVCALGPSRAAGRKCGELRALPALWAQVLRLMCVLTS